MKGWCVGLGLLAHSNKVLVFKRSCSPFCVKCAFFLFVWLSSGCRKPATILSIYVFLCFRPAVVWRPVGRYFHAFNLMHAGNCSSTVISSSIFVAPHSLSWKWERAKASLTTTWIIWDGIDLFHPQEHFNILSHGIKRCHAYVEKEKQTTKTCWLKLCGYSGKEKWKWESWLCRLSLLHSSSFIVLFLKQ